MSLLEVLLALAILGTCLATISTLVRLGTHGAVKAREMTTAQLLCEAKVAEFTAGILPAEPGGPWPFDLPEHADWEYYVEIYPLPQPGLVSMTVTVTQRMDPNSGRTKPLYFQLVRWIQDPGLEIVDPFEEQAAMEAANPTTTTPGGTNGM